MHSTLKAIIRPGLRDPKPTIGWISPWLRITRANTLHC